VTRHAGPASATVLVRYGPADLTVQVDDDGRGPAAPGGGPGPTGAANGNGIRGMRERVAALGGELTTGPRPGGGFRVQARLPLDDADGGGR
jgi:signal transduction histidine kinase